MAPRRIPARRGRGRPRAERVESAQTNPEEATQGQNGQAPYLLITQEALQMLMQSASNGSTASAGNRSISNSSNAKVIQDFKKYGPSTFDGSSVDPMLADNWLIEIENIFRHMDPPETQKVNCATFMLRGDAQFWWESTERTMTGETSWQRFKEVFSNKYFPLTVRNQKQAEFLNLRQGNKTVAEYERLFDRLSRFVPTLVDTEEKKIERFTWGLREGIQGTVTAFRQKEYALVVETALLVERDHKAKVSTNSEAEGTVGQKRKYPQQDFQRSQQQTKEPQSTQEVQPQRNTTFTKTECRNCGKRHEGQCMQGPKACYNCGQTGHFARACPKRGQNTQSAEARNTQRGRVYMMTRQEAEGQDEIVTGTIP